MTRNTKGQFVATKHWFVDCWSEDTGDMMLHAKTRAQARKLASMFAALNPNSYPHITN